MRRQKLGDFPELCKQVKDQKNIDDIKQYAAKKNLKIFWVCPIDKEHVWPALIRNRVRDFVKIGIKSKKGLTVGCPFCNGRKASKTNNLQYFMETQYPELWAYYDFTANTIDPKTVVPSTNEKHTWICMHCEKNKFSATPKDVFRKDIKKRQKYCKECTRKVRGKIYQKTMVERYGSLLDKFPEVSKEWDYDLNDFGPEDVSPSSHITAYFKCLFGHESYPAVIYNKFHAKSKCPKCTIHSSEAEIRIFLELSIFFEGVFWQHKQFGKEIDIFIPELDLAIEVDGYPWHEERHLQDRSKTKFFASKGINLIRIRDKRLSKSVPNSFLCDLSNFKFQDFKEFCSFMTKNSEMPRLDLSNINTFSKEEAFREIYSQLPKPIYENSFQFVYPEISSEFDLIKNSPFTPDMFTPYSRTKVFWLCKKGHSYPATIGDRTRGLAEGSSQSEKGRNTGCPFCSGRNPSEDNNLLFHYPGISKYWDRNKNLKEPQEYLSSTYEEVFFRCEYGHSFKKFIPNFVKSKKVNCPFCLEQGLDNPKKNLKED